MKLTHRAAELLQTLEYLNIATVSANAHPWNTPVYARHDDRLNFYWCSWKDAEHSRNIRANPRIFITLYDSTRKRGDNNLRCLYIQARACEIEDSDEISKALHLLYPQDETEQRVDLVQGPSLRRIYRAIPETMWLNDKSERQVTRETVKMRVEVPIEELLNEIRIVNK
jgi:nitroimidazol reductase NimA-like FMN-containing flavoprotein (pyridoxamine 5'-phosphate oxidase superfamily)